MAEDGDLMLMNIDIADYGDQIEPETAKITGGRWKDRRKIKKMINGKKEGPKRASVDEGIVAEAKKVLDFDFGRKRAKIDEKTSTKTQQNGGKTSTENERPVTLNKQIVSSLFTSRREITTNFDDNKHSNQDSIDPSNAPLQQDSFSAMDIPEPLLTHITDSMKLEKPTRIQKMSIPTLMSKDNDLFLHAQTGSGKTLAFLVPIVARILRIEGRKDRKSGCMAMIIAPTRELASQIYSVLCHLTRCCHYLVPCLLIGGERKKSEKARLRKGCNFIVGTPGRILDHLKNTQVIKEQFASSLRYLVFDEGDKLMELGFEETINEILQFLYSIKLDTSNFPNLPSRLVHVLCSATLKGGANKLGKLALKNYQLISSGQKQQEVNSVPDQLVQMVAIVPPKLRLVTLAGFLNNVTASHLQATDGNRKTMRTIVFLSCSDSVDFHYEVFSSSDENHTGLVGDTVRMLNRNNTILPCLKNAEEKPEVIFYKLHGSLSQQTRTATLHNFASDSETTRGKHLVMFCTDVASRGLDLPSVSTVIELDPPFTVEDHLHRIGRSARAGVRGEALLFLLPGEEEQYLERIKPFHPLGWKMLKFDQDILIPAFKGAVIKRSDGPATDEVTDWDSNATTWHLNVERRVLEDTPFKEAAAKGYTSHIKAYATHLSQEKKYFSLKNLHLGHLAKSFALRERPKALGAAGTKRKPDQTSDIKPKETAKAKMMRMARNALDQGSSEFNY
ncbi:LAMI_0H07536g1_1 [Lachancea mirantina]|uniref:ATP-dependent RNA helicase n=1 Tax=Lachancea mirantina TaxID=1230905 RepID=A0A1G4KG77_9SACH|nr:LAMI_0H07536g1_1 [Lachancea mirantina]